MNPMIKERLELAKERITEIKNESNVGSFSGFFETFSRNAEKENCKFEHQKCSFVFQSCIHKQFCSLGRGFFFGTI